MARRKPVSATELLQIKRAYEQTDEPLVSISQRFDFAHQSAITFIAKRNGWKLREQPRAKPKGEKKMRKQISTEKRDAIRRAYEDTNEKVNDIADRFGYFSASPIYELARRYGWRPRGNARPANFSPTGATWRTAELLLEKQQQQAPTPLEPLPSGLTARHEYYNARMDTLLSRSNGYWDGHAWRYGPQA